NVLTADAVRGGEYEHVILDNPFKALGSALENQSKRSVQLTEKHTRQKDKYDATGQEFVTLFRDGYATLGRPRRSLIIFYDAQHEIQSDLVQHLQSSVALTSIETLTESPVEEI